MKMEQKYIDYMLDVLERMLAIKSPSGYTKEITAFLCSELQAMGYQPNTLRKGGVNVNIGGLNPNNTETEQVTVITRDGREYEGTLQIANASVHVNPKVNDPRDFKVNIEVLLDEFVTTAKEAEELGIQNGDFIALNPRFTVTKKGYIKSRFLDDKASSAVLLTLAKYYAEEKLIPNRNVWLSFTMFEEIGHGGAAGIPDCIEDVISVD